MIITPDSCTIMCTSAKGIMKAKIEIRYESLLLKLMSKMHSCCMFPKL